MVDYLRIDNFVVDGVFYGFFGKKGGVSQGYYSSLNISGYLNDKKDAVEKNKQIICDVSGCSSFYVLKQIHSDKCIKLASNPEWGISDIPSGDALVTDVAGILIGVQTADCVPVLFYGRKSDNSPVVGVAHAGWKGALNGVLENTCNSMIEIGVLSETIIAAIGPAIQQVSYEVDDKFIFPFIEKNEDADKFFKQGRDKDKLYFDLPAYVGWRLYLTGLKKVIDCGIDTYLGEENYFSYRRMVHNNEDDCGRQASVIGIL